MADVTIVGAGPTGLMLAGELALAGVDVAVLERRTTTELVGSRARGFHGRTVELLDQRGIAERFLEAGMTAQVLGFGSTPLDVAALPSRHAYTVGIPQVEVERILLEWAAELGVEVTRGVEVHGFAQDDDGVLVETSAGTTHTGYLVGTDGGRSVVRKAAGIDFVGAEPTRSHLIAEVAITEPAETGFRLDELGIHAIDADADGRTARFVVTEPHVGMEDPTLDDLRAALRAAHGTDFGAQDPTSLSRFTDATHQAVSYRNGRVLIAGDAAHTHPPVAGQGIGLGVADAVNLGWKLAQVVRGQSPDTLLDSYQAERHPATERVLDNVMTQAWLQRRDRRTDAMRSVFAELMEAEEARTRMAGLLSGLDAAYDLGEGHPLLGRRMPDLDLVVDGGEVRVYELLREARPVLLDLGQGLATRPGISSHHAAYDGEWVLPVVGAVPAPTAVLIRPDGHVAWVGQGSDAGLDEAVARWCGGGAVLS
ncbi:FAD-dependent monooxygenase [Nocardioides sp.]|uniref:FAD-dependent monooxygenase n=1 Tax=Nocardioides sp. TaxID=35761 RepID=UPI002CAAA67A|nr:FAD-dependent monooxygenase [Nocardioides sp.]HSX65900.1 FAD-dependent monooxygenase [Nocardioides sp.]